MLEKILTPDNQLQTPKCVAGERHCPPEDCGGIWGFSDTTAGFVPSGFVIDYQTECDEGILKLIGEINEKGESYIFSRE